MILSTHPQNVDDASPDTIKPTSSHMCWTLHTTSPSNLFRSDQLPSGHLNSFRSHLPHSGLSNLFRPEPLQLDNEKMDEELVGEFLWQAICCCMKIKDFSRKQTNFCEYTLEIVACIMMTSKGHSGLDIWLETPNYGIDTKDMIHTTWYKKTIKQKKINLHQQYPLSPSIKETYYTSYTSLNQKNSYTYLVTDT